MSSELRPPSDYRAYLQRAFMRRRDQRPSYSLRAFARDLGVSPSHLHEVLNNGRNLSSDKARAIATKLRLPAAEAKRFTALVDLEGRKPSMVRARAAKTLGDTFTTLDREVIEVIAGWQHFAAYEVLALKDAPKSCEEQERWLGARLGLSPMEAFNVLRRLRAAGLLERKDGSYVRKAGGITTTTGIPSEAIRRAHAGAMRRSAQALELPVTERCFETFFLAFDRRRRNEAFARLFEFCREFNREFGEGEADSVYALGLQFVPLTSEISASPSPGTSVPG